MKKKLVAGSCWLMAFDRSDSENRTISSSGSPSPVERGPGGEVHCQHGLLKTGLLLLLFLTAHALTAQNLRDFPYADSLTHSLQMYGRWAALDSVGRAAIRVGTDYPALRQRLGDAALEQNRPARAIRHYGRALRANPAHDSTRAQLALAYLLLNQRDAASYVARLLPDSVRRPLRLRPFYALTLVQAQAGGTVVQQFGRGNAGFGQLSINTQLSPRFNLAQSLTYYRQTIQLPAEMGMLRTYGIRQGEYHALLRTQLATRWQAKIGYHFLNNDFGLRTYYGHLGYAGLLYSRPYWQVQAGLYAGRLTDTTRVQTDVQATVYPLGNLRLYGFGRGTLLHSGARTYPNALLGAGGQLLSRLWLEGFVGLGTVPVLAEGDGAYVYNLLDPLRRRFGLTSYVVLPHHLRLSLYYVREQRYQTPTNTPYSQSSFTGGLAWIW